MTLRQSSWPSYVVAQSAPEYESQVSLRLKPTNSHFCHLLLIKVSHRAKWPKKRGPCMGLNTRRGGPQGAANVLDNHRGAGS